MKKTLLFIIAFLFASGYAIAQQNDCYITYKYDASGNRVQRFYNCELPSEMQVISSTLDSANVSENEKIDANTYSIVYPNPNPGKFWVEFKNSAGENVQSIKRKIYLLNALGQVVLEQESLAQKVYIEADGLTDGNYFVTIYDGIRNASHKITIMR